MNGSHQWPTRAYRLKARLSSSKPVGMKMIWQAGCCASMLRRIGMYLVWQPLRNTMKIFVRKARHYGRQGSRSRTQIRNASWSEAQRGQVSISNGLPQLRERFSRGDGGVFTANCLNSFKLCRVGIPLLKKELRVRLACAPRGGWQRTVISYFPYGVAAWNFLNSGAC